MTGWQGALTNGGNTVKLHHATLIGVIRSSHKVSVPSFQCALNKFLDAVQVTRTTRPSNLSPSPRRCRGVCIVLSMMPAKENLNQHQGLSKLTCWNVTPTYMYGQLRDIPEWRVVNGTRVLQCCLEGKPKTEREREGGGGRKGSRRELEADEGDADAFRAGRQEGETGAGCAHRTLH